MRSIFFINCGATMDMLNFFEDLDPLTILYVADSHRPIALENTMNGAQVRVTARPRARTPPTHPAPLLPPRAHTHTNAFYCLPLTCPRF